jgi:hypothetical protein
MEDDKVISEQDLHTNPAFSMIVNKDTELKTFLVEYVGKKFDKEEVTVQMIAEVLATDFAEFTYAFAEENFIRGYELGLEDAGLSNRKQ